ncbi:MAG: hypothetical protein WKF73_12645 [Nocardioidaceae bacterium]
MLAVGLALTSCSLDDSAGANWPAAGSDATTESESSATGPTIEISQEGGQITPLGETVEAEVERRRSAWLSDSEWRRRRAARALRAGAVVRASRRKTTKSSASRSTRPAPTTWSPHSLGVVVVKLQVS